MKEDENMNAYEEYSHSYFLEPLIYQRFGLIKC